MPLLHTDYALLTSFQQIRGHHLVPNMNSCNYFFPFPSSLYIIYIIYIFWHKFFFIFLKGKKKKKRKVKDSKNINIFDTINASFSKGIESYSCFVCYFSRLFLKSLIIKSLYSRKNETSFSKQINAFFF